MPHPRKRQMSKASGPQALKYLEQNAAQVEKLGFKKFVDGNDGGIAGCARGIAKRRTRMVRAA
jgi:hypothetical protein